VTSDEIIDIPAKQTRIRIDYLMSEERLNRRLNIGLLDRRVTSPAFEKIPKFVKF